MSTVYRLDRHDQSIALGGSAVYSSLTDGLILLLRMEEAAWDGTTGEVFDSSGSGNDGTATLATTVAAGILGRGGDFNL